MTFTSGDFIQLEAQRQVLVQRYIDQRDANRTETAMTDDELKAIEARVADIGTKQFDLAWVFDDRFTAILDYVASARTDVPALVAEVRRLRKVEKLRVERAWERGWASRSGGGMDYRITDAARDGDVAEILATEVTEDELK